MARLCNGTLRDTDSSGTTPEPTTLRPTACAQDIALARTQPTWQMTLLFMLRRLAEEDEEEGRAAGEDEGQGEGMLLLYVQSVGRPGHARGTTGFLHKAARSVFWQRG